MHLRFQSNYLGLSQPTYNVYENATACSKRMRKTLVATQLYLISSLDLFHTRNILLQILRWRQITTFLGPSGIQFYLFYHLNPKKCVNVTIETSRQLHSSKFL